MAAHAVDAQAHAMVLCNPVGELRGGPGALRLGELGAGGVQDHRREGGLLATTRFVDQGSKAAVEEGLEPGADGLLMLAEGARNPWRAPAGVSQSEHLQAVARAWCKAPLAGALAELKPLL